MIFVCGLHRSGTTILARHIAESSRIGGLSGTGVAKDEGQLTHSSIPSDQKMGGAGLFGFHRDAHLTERSRYNTPEIGEAMLASWRPYWEPSADFMLEKSPPNLLRMRLLQALYPGSKFIIITRHPAAVGLATYKWKWRRATIGRLLQHWAHCHAIAAADCRKIDNYLWLKYEHLISGDAETHRAIREFAACDIPASIADAKPHVNRRYFERFSQLQSTLLGRLNLRGQHRRLESQVQLFGYSFADLESTQPFFIPTYSNRSP